MEGEMGGSEGGGWRGGRWEECIELVIWDGIGGFFFFFFFLVLFL